MFSTKRVTSLKGAFAISYAEPALIVNSREQLDKKNRMRTTKNKTVKLKVTRGNKCELSLLIEKRHNL